MAKVKVKLIDPHIDRDGRYLPSGTVVDWDDNLINEAQIPAPGLGSATTAATSAFTSAGFTAKPPPIPGQPSRYRK